MATIEFSLDGEQVKARAGETILDVARRHGKDIPTLCHDPRLEPYSSCFICLVEMEGKPGFVPSCATKVAPGMKITTDSPQIRTARKLCLELIMSAHYADCVAPCRLQCPDNIDIQTYIAQIAASDFEGALETIKRTNPFPSVCGRVCPHTCEMECRRNKVDEPVAINPLKRFVADLDLMAERSYLPEVAPDSHKRVAIIGGGPAGLSAAYYLRQKGHAVTVFEMNDKPGGMLRYGIPYYRLPEDALDREIGNILGLGVELECNQRLGADFSLADLKARGFDAVLIAVGAWTSSSMRVEGEDKPGVMAGIDYLFRVAAGEPPEVGRKVVVVGGGNTAVDAARTAKRAGADVTILYRRTRKEMPAEDFEVDEAEAEGVKMHFLAAPVGLPGNGKVERVRAIKMELGEPDASGRRRPVPQEGSEFEIEVDTVIAAIGQKPDPSCWLGEGGPESTRWNTVEANERTFQTAVPWVFTAGDCLTGAATAIEAIAGGRKAALSIDRFLGGLELLPLGKPFSDSIGRLEDLDEDLFSDVARVPRAHGRELPVAERMKGFAEVELGIDQAQALTEAGRCLECGCTAVDTCTLRSLCEDYDVDLGRFEINFQHRPVLADHPFVLYDPNKCILCGRCVRICLEQQGAAALGLVRRGFDTAVEPTLGQPLLATDCDSCGQCIRACPTGALDAKRALPKPGPYMGQCAHLACGFCGLACRLDLETISGHYVQADAEPGAYHNRGNLCVDGSFGHRYLETLPRLIQPKVRTKAGVEAVGWPQALRAAADGLGRAVAGKGVGVLVNGPLTNEEAYLLGRLARTRLGSAPVALLDEPQDVAAGRGADGPALSEIAGADLLWSVGDDPFETAPVAGVELRSAAGKGTPLVVVGWRPSRLDGPAAQVLRVGQARLAELLAGLADYARKRDKNKLAALGLSLGVKPSVLHACVERLRKARRPVVAVDDRIDPRAAAALDRLLDALKKSTRALWLRRVGNSLGRDLMGLRPGLLPGGTSAKDKRQLARIVELWGDPVRAPKVTGSDHILRAAREGKLSGVLVINTDPFGLRLAPEALHPKVFKVVFDLVDGPLAAGADVALPASALAESGGTVTSLDGRVLPTEAARAPVGGKTLFQALGALADESGRSIPLGKPEHVWKELARLRPGLAGLTAGVLDLAGTRWKDA